MIRVRGKLGTMPASYFLVKKGKLAEGEIVTLRDDAPPKPHSKWITAMVDEVVDDGDGDKFYWLSNL